MRSNCIDPQKCNDFTMPCQLPANQNTTTEAWVQAFCFGYVVDLLTELSNNLRLHFDLYIVQDGEFGRSLNKTTQEWNGMIGDVIKGRASIALQGITISTTFCRSSDMVLSLIHISEPTRRTPISYAVFCLKK